MSYRKFRYEEKTYIFEKKNDKTILAIFFVAKQYTKWNRQIKENMKNWSYAENETNKTTICNDSMLNCPWHLMHKDKRKNNKGDN